MTSTTWIDRTRPFRRLLSKVEAVELRWFGTTGLAVLYRHPSLLLTTTGRRTGRTHHTPLACLPEAPGRWLVTGGAGGQTATPDWVWNLRANPRATITVKRRRLDVVATELEGEHRSAAWDRLTARWPEIERFQRVAGRTVPVFRLEAPPGGG